MGGWLSDASVSWHLPAVRTLLLSPSTLLHHRPHCPSSQDFRHPTTLSQLAIFLRDAMARRHNTHKAMVLFGPPDNDDHCYVVALRAKESAGVMQVGGCGGGGLPQGEGREIPLFFQYWDGPG